MNDKNVIDLKQARKDKEQKDKEQKKKKEKKLGQNSGPVKLTIFHWLQFVLFLVVFGYMMTLCRGGGS